MSVLATMIVMVLVARECGPPAWNAWKRADGCRMPTGDEPALLDAYERELVLPPGARRTAKTRTKGCRVYYPGEMRRDRAFTVSAVSVRFRPTRPYDEVAQRSIAKRHGWWGYSRWGYGLDVCKRIRGVLSTMTLGPGSYDSSEGILELRITPTGRGTCFPSSTCPMLPDDEHKLVTALTQDPIMKFLPWGANLIHTSNVTSQNGCRYGPTTRSPSSFLVKTLYQLPSRRSAARLPAIYGPETRRQGWRMIGPLRYRKNILGIETCLIIEPKTHGAPIFPVDVDVTITPARWRSTSSTSPPSPYC